MFCKANYTVTFVGAYICEHCQQKPGRPATWTKMNSLISDGCREQKKNGIPKKRKPKPKENDTYEKLLHRCFRFYFK